MEIACEFGPRTFLAGSQVSVVVRARSVDVDLSDCTVYAQAHAHISVDERWIALPQGIHAVFQQHSAYHVHKRVQIPKFNHVSRSGPSACVYITSREVVDSIAQGAVITFELPRNCLPSFKGHSISITYMLTISLEPQSGGMKHVHFPFYVVGAGSRDRPFQVRYSPLTTLPLLSLPSTSRTFYDTDQDDLVPKDRTACVQQSFAIKNNEGGLIAIVTAQQQTLLPGDDVTTILDFSDRTVGCFMVEARLMMRELTMEDKVVQQNAFETTSFYATDLLREVIIFTIPSTAPGTLVTPLAKVEWLLELEFQLRESAEDTLIWRTSLVVGASGLS